MHSRISLPKGIYHDRLIRTGGHVIDLGWRSNIVVDRCRSLLAAFMRGDPPSSGIQFLAVGKGLEAWDSLASPTPPASSDEQLEDSSPFPITVDSTMIEYLDAAGNTSTGATNRVQVTVTMGPGTPPIDPAETTYPLREFGLFGSLNGVDYMIDYVRHPVIHKQADDTLVRTIRLVF